MSVLTELLSSVTYIPKLNALKSHEYTYLAKKGMTE